MKIVFTGGGTAGHIFPLLAILREIKKAHRDLPELEFFYVGPKDGYPLQLLAKEGAKIRIITTGKIRRYFSFKNFLDVFKMPVGFFQALFWLFISPPDLIFSKGGYASFPAVLASRILAIPIFLHESDSCPGMTARITSRWALEIFTSFQETEYFKKEKMIFVGNPVRTEILGGSKKEAKGLLRLEGKKPLIGIIGGSQGAQSINNLILEILPELLGDFELVHQTGKKNYAQVKSEAKVLMSQVHKKRYHPIPFLNEKELRAVLGAADLIISRAGAGALFEIAASGKPAIIIPLPGSAQDHQAKNAYQYSKTGAAQVLEHENLKPHFFLERIRYFFSRPRSLKNMAASTELFAGPKAGGIIASYLLEYLEQSKKGKKKQKK